MATVQETDWGEAWASARKTLSGITRTRVPGASDDVEIALIDWGGEGPLAFFHHANGFCAETLAPIAHALRDRFRVVAMDCRGHGNSTPVVPERDAYHWDVLARDVERAVAAAREQTGQDRVALALGHSFGGALLLRAASLGRTPIDRLLLCDPVLRPKPVEGGTHARRGSGLAEATRKRRDRFPSFAAAYDHCRTRGLFADFTPEALALYVGEGMVETDDGDEIRLKCDREIEAAIFDGDSSSVCAEDVEDVRARTLFVHAQRGNFALATYEAIAARMPDAWVESRDLGHLFPLEAPQAALDCVAALLRDDRSGRAIP
ncbi:MAG: alpha/beta hydrolase [bacterium]|nr:alpha/beta hydrolase [bacterium]